MLKPILFTAALLASAGAAHAQTGSFTPGGSSPASGQTVIYNFDTTTPGAGNISGSNYQFLTGNGPNGVAPQSANPGGRYLSVLGGGLATITFSAPVTAFSFDWGSVDSYNTLTVLGSFGQRTFSGAAYVGSGGNGTSSGLFTFQGGGGTISSFSLASSSNSFEIDNVAVTAVPEPAAWAFMILGFGAVGATMRRRQRVTARYATA